MKKVEAYECELCHSVFTSIDAAESHEEVCRWEREGHAVWVEDGKVKHAPPVPPELFGPHEYEAEGTSDCRFGCGCWAGPARSGGPVAPFGPCPHNFRGEYVPATGSSSEKR